jgi:branched-chain amino acid transport system ATP-binding protein
VIREVKESDRVGARPHAPASRQLASHALRLERVGRRFGALVALDDVSLTVAPGERRAIIGANGAGKTTLFNTVTGDFPPTAGRIFFFDEDVTRLPPHERIRRGLRRTYQNSMLFQGLSVIHNLYLATRGITRGRLSPARPAADDQAMERARELAHAVHLEGVAGRLVAELSHGQKRQLEVGMALVGAPRLVLFDEPAAGLSPAERRDLLALLRSLPSHVGFIVIEHDLEIALSAAERVTVMHGGRIFKEGTPGEIEVDAEVQAIYLGGRRG